MSLANWPRWAAVGLSLAAMAGVAGAASLRVTPPMEQACHDSDPAKAIAACKAILDLGDIPDYARRDALDSRAMAYIAQGQSDPARADAEALARLARDTDSHARAEALLGQAFAVGEHYEDAVEALNEALRIDPGDTDSLALRGEALDKLRRDDEAKRDLTEVVTRRRNQVNPYLDRGRFYFRRNQFRQAEDDFEHAVTNGASSSLAYYWRAMVRLRCGNADAAGADLDAAIHLHQRFPAALAQRAKLYETVGDRSRAAEYYRLAAAGPENDPDSREARAWVAAYHPPPTQTIPAADIDSHVADTKQNPPGLQNLGSSDDTWTRPDDVFTRVHEN